MTALEFEHLASKLEDLKRRQPRGDTELVAGMSWILELCELMLEISEHTLVPDRKPDQL